MFDGWETLLGGRVTAVRWDQRGCGRSEQRGPYSVAQSVADLDAVRRHLGVERVAVLGHSWGAQLALRYALDYPGRVSRLVYGSGVGLGWDWYEPFARNLTARLGTAAERVARLREVIRREGTDGRSDARERELAVLQWSAEFADPAAGAQYAEQMATPWFGINWECSASINAELKATWREPELIAACQSLRMPVLILEGACLASSPNSVLNGRIALQRLSHDSSGDRVKGFPLSLLCAISSSSHALTAGYVK
jgi:proline iminopeptidase